MKSQDHFWSNLFLLYPYNSKIYNEIANNHILFYLSVFLFQFFTEQINNVRKLSLLLIR